MDINLLPKIRLEIVVCKVPVETVVEAAKKALYTGKIGDGKIFVYDVENVIKVRTGEEGYARCRTTDTNLKHSSIVEPVLFAEDWFPFRKPSRYATVRFK